MRAARGIAALLAVAVATCCTPTGAALAQPESVAPTDFVALRDIDPTILQDIRYFTAHNFTGGRVDG
ncbi:hypothetical protein [Mycobacterium sp.]|uniref:hypothetical protein n=1 Tax=Mycobacterium sp. TaxID=1785 RepID=UPI002C852287|nr:hypothetical protein [Mycobacterium sp.]HTQ20786.1 hypothetical protein [Mycobacterium sp.]